MEANWSEMLPRLREKVGDRNFATWIAPIRCSRDPAGFCLEVGSAFFQEWVSRHFLTVIRETLSEFGLAGQSVRVVVTAEGAPGLERHAVPASPLPATPAPARRGLARQPKIGRAVPEYTFDSFVVGETNATSYEAARRIAETPGRQFNPLFIWGGVGLGKTHLVNAIANEVLQRARRRRVACLSAESFMNTLISALRQDHMSTFRDRFRDVDVLILDDVQFLAGKERTQEEFFHTFNALYEAGHQVILTSDKPPGEIAQLEQRLRSRFEGGLISDIRPPTREMRHAIVLRKAAQHGVDLPSEVAAIVAERSGPSVRELEGALTRILAMAALRDLPLTVTLALEVLPGISPAFVAVSVEAVQAVVCRHFGLEVGDLVSHRRARALALPRQIAMYLSRTVARASFPSIAEKFGGRDHSTVMYAVRSIEEKRTQDARLEQQIALLAGSLGGPVPKLEAAAGE